MIKCFIKLSKEPLLGLKYPPRGFFRYEKGGDKKVINKYRLLSVFGSKRWLFD